MIFLCQKRNLKKKNETLDESEKNSIMFNTTEKSGKYFRRKVNKQNKNNKSKQLLAGKKILKNNK